MIEHIHIDILAKIYFLHSLNLNLIEKKRLEKKILFNLTCSCDNH